MGRGAGPDGRAVGFLALAKLGFARSDMIKTQNRYMGSARE
jgi:hypothetical protein